MRRARKSTRRFRHRCLSLLQAIANSVQDRFFDRSAQQGGKSLYLSALRGGETKAKICVGHKRYDQLAYGNRAANRSVSKQCRCSVASTVAEAGVCAAIRCSQGAPKTMDFPWTRHLTRQSQVTATQ